jgi:hypothetical protein
MAACLRHAEAMFRTQCFPDMLGVFAEFEPNLRRERIGRASKYRVLEAGQ